MKARGGFTLIELLVASAIAAIVMAQALGALVFCWRLTEKAYKEMELALAARQVRDKLLFQCAPGKNGVVYPGVLSANLSVDSVALNMSKVYCEKKTETSRFASDPREKQTIRLMLDGSSGERRLYNESMQASRAWFYTSKVPFATSGESWHSSSSCDWGSVVNSGDYTKANGNVLHLNLTLTAGGFVRRERVMVPVFGAAHYTEVN